MVSCQVLSHGMTDLLPEQGLIPTNPSRLKKFEARLAAEAERCADKHCQQRGV